MSVNLGLVKCPATDMTTRIIYSCDISDARILCEYTVNQQAKIRRLLPRGFAPYQYCILQRTILLKK